MYNALASPPVLPAHCISLRGENLPGKKGRHIYTHSWNILREIGFSRPFRCEVFESISLFLPFVKGSIAVLPQGFQSRIPLELRARALVGKSAALRAKGIHLIVAAAAYEETTWNTLQLGNCSVCTSDKLKQLIQTLDFSQ
jgi:hypothetical protein